METNVGKTCWDADKNVGKVTKGWKDKCLEGDKCWNERQKCWNGDKNVAMRQKMLEWGQKCWRHVWKVTKMLEWRQKMLG